MEKTISTKQEFVEAMLEQDFGHKDPIGVLLNTDGTLQETSYALIMSPAVSRKNLWLRLGWRLFTDAERSKLMEFAFPYLESVEPGEQGRTAQAELVRFFQGLPGCELRDFQGGMIFKFPSPGGKDFCYYSDNVFDPANFVFTLLHRRHEDSSNFEGLNLLSQRLRLRVLETIAKAEADYDRACATYRYPVGVVIADEVWVLQLGSYTRYDASLFVNNKIRLLRKDSVRRHKVSQLGAEELTRAMLPFSQGLVGGDMVSYGFIIKPKDDAVSVPRILAVRKWVFNDEELQWLEAQKPIS